jgi:Domain of unknown function (DUF1906)
MHEIIDVASDISEFAIPLAAVGVKTVIRYYNNRNTSQHPSKCLVRAELRDLHAAGLSVGVVFQQRGGQGGHIEDLDSRNGVRDANRALALAADLGQPEGSAIYFGVDHDYFRRSELDRITPYFEKVKEALSGRYRVGVYSSGTVAKRMKSRGLIDLTWLAGATGWSGTEDALRSGDFTIFQKFLEKRSEIGRFDYDGNVVNPSAQNFGQFGPDGVLDTAPGQGAAAIFKVIARPDLNLRGGPGESFPVVRKIPLDTLVTARGRDGPWLAIDLEGDGNIDGFMFARFLEPVSGKIRGD